MQIRKQAQRIAAASRLRNIKRKMRRIRVRRKQRRRARKRPTQAEILVEFSKALQKAGLGELAVNPEAARKLRPAQIDSLLQTAQDTYTRIARRRIIYYSLRQFGIRSNKAELAQAIENIIARRWQKDTAGNEHYKRDVVLIENFNKIYAILGKRKGNALVGVVVKKMHGFFPVPMKEIAALGLQKAK